MNIFPKLSYSNGNADFVSTKQFEHKSDERVFCTKDNLEESLHELSEELSSFGIASVTPDNNDDLQSAELLKQLSVKVINSTWNLIHKYRSLMQLYEKTVLSNRKTCNDNVHLKNQITRLKEDLQKNEQALCEAEKKKNKLQDDLKDVSRDLKHMKEETQKLKKQVQSKDVQHKHEINRILQINQKLQNHLQKPTVQRKVSPKTQTDQEKELASYKKTVCRLEENNRQMLEEINKLNETLALHKEAIDLQMLASGAWTDVNE
ncbi:afadin- and alpha-actinin-binding protein-like isoform X2 [Odontomachus brunneus]|uniref:afadin- and alpha-actinin-binding protein-like isoform X2 n=1 Tax=Odontomachus brunneus TaxID=486640 RepID=UPI0013F202D1|nr:afadin- and alpha-actinin-binding protein-like isoform X2 [Odontomachus brunneus]